MEKFLILPFLVLTSLSAHAIEPFAPPTKLPTKVIKPLVVGAPQTINIFDPASAANWSYDNVPQQEMAGVHVFEQVEGKNAVRIFTKKFVPAVTTLRATVPADANGDVWNKNKASYISLLCKSDKSLTMSFHLLKKGKTPGTYQAPFPVSTGQWQRVIIPIERFNLKNFAGVVGVAFRVAGQSTDANVLISDVSVGGLPYSDESWKTHRLSVSLKGNWQFAPDSNNEGSAKKWESDSFDDSAWKTLKSDSSWSTQGVNFSGWGWFRQKLFVPKEFAGNPLTLSLMENPSDDNTYFNGVKIGGWSGEYKYKTQITRTYTVPASLIRYGELNTIAVRIWGGNLSFIGDQSRSIKGPLTAEIDPYRVMMRETGAATEQPAELFDISDAQRGMPFELVFRLPAELFKTDGALQYNLTDYTGQTIASGKCQVTVGSDGIARGIAQISREISQTIYLRGRFKAELTVLSGEQPIYIGTREINRLSFAKRDTQALPALPETFEDTPYGKLKLVDEIDASTAIGSELHPYLQSGFESEQKFETAGSNLNVFVRDILGKKARESDYGWFAYRIGRGKLKPHTNYLARIEYPEDKPRYSPIELQIGQNFLDVGWKNGLSPTDPYDPWPLSNKWQWYDTVVSLDDETVGTGGTGSASAENGFWVYFMNKIKAGSYHANYAGGPAVGRIKLYEIDPTKNAPVINTPKNLPQRTLMLDWERQPDGDPADFARYAKLMGYNAISPVIIKWGHANYSEPLKGYNTVNVDAQSYWVTERYDAASGQPVGQPIPNKPSVHARYLAATKQYGINYMPRFEYGGSYDLPEAAKAIGADGKLAKPNRFDNYGANLLNPQTFDDLKLLMDHLVKPYAKDNPQLMGALWRIRSDRMPISYGPDDLALFAKETNTKLPAGGYEQQAAWATGEMKGRYDDWWHQKRAQFHAKVVELLKSYRPDLALYYYNWDPDKFGLINPDINAWGFVSDVIKPAPLGGAAAYEKESEIRKSFTAEDYIEVLRTGNFGKASGGINRADYGIRPSLYKDIKGIQIFAPANYPTYADKADYINYFQTADGLAASYVISYDELAARYINPKYEGNMLTPAGPSFSMAMELLSYFHGDARTLTYTSYTYGRGFADAHRRFAQAFLALPALQGQVVAGTDADTKVRQYPTANGTYVGVAYKGYESKKLTIKLSGTWKANAVVKNLVTGETVPSSLVNNQLQFPLSSGPMELNSFLIQ